MTTTRIGVRSRLEQHIELGKAGRRSATRSAHAEYELDRAGRTDPVELLQAQAAGRLPELVPIRHGRMLATRFAFYRGAAAVMAADLAATPASGVTVQLCGDAHAANFGLYASPERHLVFDLNDFDETSRGPWEWDVKRLAASVEICGGDNQYTPTDRRRAVLEAVGAYRRTMRRLAELGHLDVWYEHVDFDDPGTLEAARLDKRMRARVDRGLDKARAKDSARAARRLTEVVDGRRRIVSTPPLVERLDDLLGDTDRVDLESRLSHIFDAYRASLPADRQWLLEQFHVVDIARKVVGVGSVGTRCWVVLMVGRDDDDVLFLQMKEAGQSVLAPYTGGSPAVHEGQRVVLGQRQMQTVTDIFLGWHRSTGLDDISRDFYVRQLADWKGGADLARMAPDGLVRYSVLCGLTLARAHARSGDRVAIAAYLGSGDTFDRAVAQFAAAYADQNARDHDRLVEAAVSGRIEAASA
jgi:hypothetical protein